MNCTFDVKSKNSTNIPINSTFSNFVYMMRTLKLYSVHTFQLNNSILLAIVTTLQLLLELNHLSYWNFVPFDQHLPNSPISPTLGNHHRVWILFFTCESLQYLSFYVWAILFNIISTHFVCVYANNGITFYFKAD